MPSTVFRARSGRASTFASFVVPAAVTIALCWQTGANADKDAVPSALQSRYSTLIKAVDAVDGKAFAGCFAPQFVSVDPSGKVATRTEFLNGIQGIFKGAKKGSMHVVFKGATTHAGTVDVSCVNDAKISSAAGVTTIHEVCVDSWKKTGGKWYIVKTVDTVFDVTMPKPAKSQMLPTKPVLPK